MDLPIVQMGPRNRFLRVFVLIYGIVEVRTFRFYCIPTWRTIRLRVTGDQMMGVRFNGGIRNPILIVRSFETDQFDDQILFFMSIDRRHPTFQIKSESETFN